MSQFALESLPGFSGVVLAVNQGEEVLVTDTQSALDLIATTHYNENCNRLILRKEDVDEAFFDLKTGIAGEILQKFVNYGMQLAIVGDFSGYKSHSLRDFLYECNHGNAIFFTPTIEEAAARLKG